MTISLSHILLFCAVVAACKPVHKAATQSRWKEGVTVALATLIRYVKKDDRHVAWFPSPGISRYEVIVSRTGHRRTTVQLSELFTRFLRENL
jgi:hypothetical protein